MATSVRRKDYQFQRKAEILAFLDAMSHGFLAFIREDGSPGLVALNYVRAGGSLYFHSAHEGEKVRSLGADPRVTFMVADGFSIIPSYFRDPELACPASQYYKTVVIHGVVRFVETREERAAALQALMEKLQPEGGYRPIRAEDPFYWKSLDTTNVFALDLEDVTAKFKFGQNLPRRGRAAVARRLEARGEPIDHDTTAAMRAICPFES